MLIATAGHVDHGKTALVRALTGVETDRLAEEKARGISIDLGFAYQRTDEGQMLGFVDVPGHERFVRNMVAGVSGAQFALVVIAADDGIMPQTIEHVRILDLMGVARGVVVISKCDRADAARIAQVEQEAAVLLATTALAGYPTFRVSATTGQGVAALDAALRAAASAEEPGESGQFRLAIDKCFSVPGAGTIASGTVLSGSVAQGDHLILAPQGRDVRVRGLQSGGAATDRACAGQRCALNLAGVEVDQVHRGDWLVPLAQAVPTSRIDAQVHLVPEREASLRHDSRVHLHIATAAIPARVLMQRQSPLLPGHVAVARLVLEHPTLAVNGDRFVLRDQSGRELLGGGRVLDPHPPQTRSRGGEREAVLAALGTFDVEAALEALVKRPGAEVDKAWFERIFNLAGEEAACLIKACGVDPVGRSRGILVAEDQLEAGRKAILAALARHHQDHPEAGGVTLRKLRQRLDPRPSAELLAWQVRQLIDAAAVAQSGAFLRLPVHNPTFSTAENALWQDLLATIGEGPPQQISLAEAARTLRASEGAVRTMLYRRRQNGDLWALDEGRFMLRDHVSALAECAARLARDHPEGFSAAQFRDAGGIGRNLVIRVLEFFDRIGITGRRGDVRIMHPDWRAAIGG